MYKAVLNRVQNFKISNFRIFKISGIQQEYVSVCD
jgi:hypothetical protein